MPTTQALSPRAGGALRRAGVASAGLRALAWALIASLVALSLHVALATVAPPPTQTLPAAGLTAPADVVYDPIRHAHGFHALETGPGGTSYRWTNGHATMTFPYAAIRGEHVTISARIAAAWAPGQEPVEGILRVNGYDAGTFRARLPGRHGRHRYQASPKSLPKSRACTG